MSTTLGRRLKSGVRRLLPTGVSSGVSTGAVVRVLSLALALPLLVSPNAEGTPRPAAAITGNRLSSPFTLPEAVDGAGDSGTGGPAPNTPVVTGPGPAGGDDPVAGARTQDQPATNGVADDVASPTAAVPSIADTVERTPPDLLVYPKRALDSDRVFAARRVDGVGHLAETAKLTVQIRVAEDQTKPLDLLVVDPIAFRPLTPEATAQARAAWERLFAGDVMMRHDVAQRLNVPLGGRRTLTGPGGSRTLRVGALASNGTPPVAEAVVAWDVGSDLGAAKPNLLVASTDGREAEDVGADILQAVGGGDVRPVTPPTRQQATLRGEGSHRFEPFSYVDHGDGMITIQSDWVAEHIAVGEVPIFGQVKCHRVMIPQLRAALAEVQRRGLAHLIDTSQYGGCWVPRHILFNPSRSLSMHAWGLAIDFNVATNQYGAPPQLDPRIVDIFRRWGFRWGGGWSTPDGMHFELASIIR